VDQKNVPKLFTHIETSPFLYVSSVLAREKRAADIPTWNNLRPYFCNLD